MQIDIDKIIVQPNHPVHTHKPIKHLENKRNTSQGMPLLINELSQQRVIELFNDCINCNC